MTLRRQSFVAFLLLTAVVSLFFSPLLQTHGGSARHPLRANAASLAAFTYSLSIATSSFSSTVPGQRALHSEGLIELHCARLC
jgi:hypothetical protein